MNPRAARILRRLVVVIAAVVVLGGWAIPTFAGRYFVNVTGRIVAVPDALASGRAIVLPDGSLASSGRARVEIEITNHYPLPVLLDFQGSAFRAGLVGRDETGGQPVWQTSADDPLLEQADDSPDGIASPRVIRIQPGATIVTADGLALDLAEGSAAAPGIYSLQISAYGIAGAPLHVSIIDGTAYGR
jgi:hypothetical protein